MSEFTREHRYWVFKRTQIHPLLDFNLRQMAGAAPNEVKPECVVVEHDWPEYEIVWDMIQARVEGRPDKITELTDKLAEANARVEALEAERVRLKADNAWAEQVMSSTSILLSRFPVVLRKMWSGGEVQEWINKQLAAARGE